MVTPVGTATLLTALLAALRAKAGPTVLNEETRDYCLHESFNATCRPGFVILMTSANYGRMKLGRCINGDFNIGCSKDVIRYFDSQCSAKETCDVSVRNLVDVHPCQRDFMSYLETSYRCIEVTALSSYVCPREGKVRISSQSGHVVHGLQHRSVHSLVGSDSCPWSITVKPGQKLNMKIIILGDEDAQPAGNDDIGLCSTLFVINDVISGITEVAVCAGRSRERHLYTSVGNHVTLYMSRDLLTDHGQIDRVLEYPRFILSYEAVGCPDLVVPSNALLQRMGDNAKVKCNDTFETWYLSCQGNTWIGEIGNCSHKGFPLVKDDEALKTHGSFPTHGIVLAVLLGVALGIFIGMVLLLAVHFIRRRSSMGKESSMLMMQRKDEDALMPSVARRNSLRTPNDSNYPALIMNMDKLYDFETLYGQTMAPPGDDLGANDPVMHRVLSHHVSSFDASSFGGAVECTCRPFESLTSPRHLAAIDDGVADRDLELPPAYDQGFEAHGYNMAKRRVPGGEHSKLYEVGGYPPGLRTPKTAMQQQQQQQQQLRVDATFSVGSLQAPSACSACLSNT